jgi:2-oxoglutarate ferredoxin oxidoreductase subunit gamma
MAEELGSGRIEVRICGFGGQGIVRAGVILGLAASIYAGKNAAQSQSYGPEARGGSCRSEVVISNSEIDYPKIEVPDVVVIMSQEAYRRYANEVKKDGLLIVDPEMVPEAERSSPARVVQVPASKIADELGRRIVSNVVMLGALTALTKIVPVEAVEKAILSSVPKGTEDLNLSAFRKGYAFVRPQT